MAESLARARANLRYRSKAQTERYNNSARRILVASFRSYLNVPIAEHRKALIRQIISKLLDLSLNVFNVFRNAHF
ncbi:hypothetical protein ARMSODRAFT_957227 [Armillaria solidipes]|uniref:Uncharacterized protein n=1 Tax=Armillaria solidipes TaxID=1076256 RepID=A0A2H3BU44_9AGAR|nr:hypothetical protein ARMSODRAFT_957227 [Armillaria solidipes]